MSVIEMLPSAEVDDLPVVVKFILQSVGDGDAFEVQEPERYYYILLYTITISQKPRAYN